MSGGLDFIFKISKLTIQIFIKALLDTIFYRKSPAFQGTQAGSKWQVSQNNYKLIIKNF